MRYPAAAPHRDLISPPKKENLPAPESGKTEKSVNDVTLGILVEEMDSRSVDRNLHGIAGASCGACGNGSDDVLLLKVEVEVNLRTHKLGNVNRSLDNAFGIVLYRKCVVGDALGTDSRDNFLADVVLDFGIVRLLCGELDTAAADNKINI